MQSRDGTFDDTLSFTAAAVDAYLVNTDLTAPALHEDEIPPNTPSGSNNADANDSASIYDNPAVNLDGADVTDADTFEELTRGDGQTDPCEIAVDRPSDIPEEGGEETIEIESNSTKSSSVVVDIFPFGDPGAPIPGVPQGHTSYERFRATQGDTVWAPFRSQRDWEIACWAKRHSMSSTAVAELLAIPEVCAALFSQRSL